jgi:hypothetical protein
MSFSDIIGTPLHFILTFTRAGLADNPPPEDIDLGAPASVVFRTLLLSKLPQAVADALTAALTTPLDRTFDQLWADNRDTIGGMVKAAIQQSTPGAYDIFTIVPDKGTLRAEVTGLSIGIQPLFPPGTTGKQLNLSYSVPGFNGLFTKPTDSIFGKWADPTFSFSFDGEVLIFIGVPDSARIPISTVGPPPTAAVRVEFATHNTSGSPEGIGAWLDALGNVISAWWNGQPLPSSGGDQTVPILLATLQALVNQLTQLSQGFQAAAAAGFTLLEPEIISDPSTGANAAAFHLTHPFDPAPQIVSTSSPPVPSLFNPVIGTNTPVINAGGSLTVHGSFFPLAQSNQLGISWNDTSEGEVAQSEIQWGQYASQPPMPPPAPTIPAVPNDVVNARNGRNDNGNNFQTPKNLIPSTWYGFRVRDFDLPNAIATRWSAWTAFQTSATDSVMLRLDYALTSAALGAATLSSSGDFSINVTIPAAVPPGTYPIWASLGGQDMAFAPIRVLAAGATLPASLQLIDALTGNPIVGVARVEESFTYTIQGLSFNPGPVQLFIDSANGASLGQTTADANGYFKTTITWPYSVLGPHNVVAIDQQNQQTTAAVYGFMLPR